MKNIKGFTLLELSVVLIIMSLLFMGTFEGAKYLLLQNNINSTNTKLRAIKNAIDIYVITNGNLPCPAPLKNNSGESYSDCNNNISSIGFYYSNGFSRGGIPYKTLNLTENYSYDAWKSKITYTIYSDGAVNFKKIDEKDFNRIKIKEKSQIFTNKAIYSLISHGQNKAGAVMHETNKENTIKPSDDEKNNLFNSNYDINVYSSNDENFDDILLYQTRMQILIENGIDDVDCYLDNTTISILLNNKNIQSQDFSNLPNNNYLSYNEEISSDTNEYKIKCYKFGRLDIFKYE